MTSSSDQINDMLFTINDENRIDENQHIATDLYTAILYLNQYKKTQLNGGNIQISYFMPSGTMRENAIYMNRKTTKRYKCTNLYIFKSTHKLSIDSPYEGELVIELTPVTNNASKLYICFLLKNTRYTNTPPNEIDEIISNSIKPPTRYSTMNFTLNNLIEKNQKRILYKSGIDTVIIYTKPIPISEIDFSGYNEIPDYLFAKYPVGGKYKILPTNTLEGFSEIIREGVDQTLTCQMIDVKDGTTKGDETMTYLMDNVQSKNLSQQALGISVIICTFCILGAYFGGPFIFFKLIQEPIGGENVNYITIASIVIMLLWFILGFILMICGLIYDANATWVGIFSLLFLFLSVMAISMYKETSFSFEIVKDFANNFAESISVFKTHIVEKTTNNISRWFIAVCLFIAYLVVLIPVVFSQSNTKSMKIKNKNTPKYTDFYLGITLGIGIPYGLLFMVWMASLIK